MFGDLTDAANQLTAQFKTLNETLRQILTCNLRQEESLESMRGLLISIRDRHSVVENEHV